MADCTYHPGKDAVGACVNCGKMVCTACRHELQEKVYCGPCANKLFVRKDEIQADKTARTPVTQSAQAEPAATSQIIKTTAASPAQPVSGAWWLLPVLLVFLGGIIAWAATKDRDPKKAKSMLKWGIILTFIYAVIIIAIYFVLTWVLGYNIDFY